MSEEDEASGDETSETGSYDSEGDTDSENSEDSEGSEDSESESEVEEAELRPNITGIDRR